MVEESPQLTIFEPVKPVGKCGLCGNLLYPHTQMCQNITQPNCDSGLVGAQPNCPLLGPEWSNYQYLLRTQGSG